MLKAFTKKRAMWAGVAALGVLTGSWLKPGEESTQRDPYFEALQTALRTQHIGHPVILIDLDRVDENLAEIRRVLGADFRFRATTKSLPSYELLEYVLKATGSSRVMEFYGPFLRPLADRLGNRFATPLDILLGKPLPAVELANFLSGPPLDPAVTVRWLIDSPQRLAEYLEVAKGRGVRLDVAFEIDVGLHRGGLTTPDALLALMETARSQPQHLRVTGVMGYDGHVPHAPPLLRTPLGAQQAAFQDAMRNLGRFVDPLRARFPELLSNPANPANPADPGFVINAGGSKTYTRYRPIAGGPPVGPATELGIGSAVLKPADFDVPTLKAHRPAVFIAEPVLKRLSPGELPCAEGIGALWRRFNPNRHDSLFVYSGGWNLDPVYPVGLHGNPLYNSRPSDNRIPNQILLNCNRHHFVQPGDFVFYRPLQSDALMQFEEILVMRGGRLIATWHPLPRRL